MSERSTNTLETWNKLAVAYHDKFSQLNLYDSSYLNFCNSIAANKVNLLEIGCGPGTLTSYLVHHRPDFRTAAIDGAPAMIELAKKDNSSSGDSTNGLQRFKQTYSKI